MTHTIFAFSTRDPIATQRRVRFATVFVHWALESGMQNWHLKRRDRAETGEETAPGEGLRQEPERSLTQ